MSSPAPEWVDSAKQATAYWRHLGDVERERLIGQAWELDQTRRWEGLEGLEGTPQMRASISALASLLTVNVGIHVLADVTSILIAPTSVTGPTRFRLGGSMVRESPACVLGASLLHGPVRISWDRIVTEGRSRAGSVVVHEFAHKVDMADGLVSGTPPIADQQQSFRFDRAVDDALGLVRTRDDPEPLSSYAGWNPAELFAVSTEMFFFRPVRLRARYGELYGALAGFYRQNPEPALP